MGVETRVDLQFGRRHGGDLGKPWLLKITDSRSRLGIVSVELSDEDFARIMSGGFVSNLDATAYNTLPEIGMRAVHATAVSEKDYKNRAETEAATKAQCPDGFQFSHGSWNNAARYCAHFVRYEPWEDPIASEQDETPAVNRPGGSRSEAEHHPKRTSTTSGETP